MLGFSFQLKTHLKSQTLTQLCPAHQALDWPEGGDHTFDFFDNSHDAQTARN